MALQDLLKNIGERSCVDQRSRQLALCSAVSRRVRLSGVLIGRLKLSCNWNLFYFGWQCIPVLNHAITVRSSFARHPPRTVRALPTHYIRAPQQMGMEVFLSICVQKINIFFPYCLPSIFRQSQGIPSLSFSSIFLSLSLNFILLLLSLTLFFHHCCIEMGSLKHFSAEWSPYISLTLCGRAICVPPPSLEIDARFFSRVSIPLKDGTISPANYRNFFVVYHLLLSCTFAAHRYQIYIQYIKKSIFPIHKNCM
jgi:hypothetical protein